MGVEESLCVVGDFNVVRNENGAFGGLSDPRWFRHPSCTVEERRSFELLLQDRGLVSLGEHYGLGDVPTWFKSVGHLRRNQGLNLDHCLCPKPFLDRFVGETRTMWRYRSH